MSRSTPLNQMPDLILDEVFSYLNTSDVARLRLVCQDFHSIALPKLFRVHTLRNVKKAEGYGQFIQKYAPLVKGLIIPFKHLKRLQDSGLTLSKTFPRLRSISFKMRYNFYTFDVIDFAYDCLSLKSLKHISIYGLYPKNVFDNLKPIIRKLDSLYVDFYPYSFFKKIQDYAGLKKLSINVGLSDSSNFRDIKVGAPFINEIVLLHPQGPAISSKSSNSSFKWAGYPNNNPTGIYLKLTPSIQYTKPTTSEEKAHAKGEFSEGYLIPDSYEDFIEIAKVPDLVQHCTMVGHSDWNSTRPEILAPLKSVTSIDIKPHALSVIDFLSGGEPFQATKLSLDCSSYSSKFIDWTISSFPNLQHLYINSTASDKMLPLKSNAFPNLTHFYSKFRQSNAFWTRLMMAAPKLQFIHTDTIREGALKLNPSIQVRPYRNILGTPERENDKSGFNKYLF
ncbi:hypothetical protein DSO57_1016176 [Entomophthora muscae]|uniref:Uncharacterized protein n=1 Tax=Entomophthora muscae TaxID=34485 RepID=A0ACC2TFI2_9FUNG|nr:hypothetical protein DSO57_1016176 [Entomophthora muscae]